MKKAIHILVILLMVSNLFGQSPKAFKYQAIVRDNSGNVISNKNVKIQISILQGSILGSVVYSETHLPATNQFGLVNLEIGNGTLVSGNLSSIDWANGPYFVKISVNDIELGTTQLLSVPYSIFAEKAGNGFSGNYNDLSNKPTFDGTWANITGKPTTIAGYGISDAINTAHVVYGITSTNIANWNSAFSWGNHAGLYRPIGYVPSWSEITGKPTFDGTWTSITGKPTTIAGYGISDAMSTSHVAYGITSAKITNWNTAFSWGNHAGLYRPIGYVPAWSEITGKPTLAAVALSGDFNNLINRPTFNGTWTSITGKPTTIAGYGITDAFNGNWLSLTGKPTTIAGYGIIDGVTTAGDQTIAGNKTFTGTINASNRNITNIATPINLNDAATKAYVDNLEQKIIRLERTLMSGSGLIADYDGNIYNTVKIGPQVWMAENLKTTHYSNGDLIATTIPVDLDISSVSVPNYQWPVNGDESNVNEYGRLYTWYVATDARNVCPVGWHVPSLVEFNLLLTNAGGIDNAGDNLKEVAGSGHWLSAFDSSNPNTSTGNNMYGFSWVGNGNRYPSPTTSGIFTHFKQYGCIYTTTLYDPNIPYHFHARAEYPPVYLDDVTNAHQKGMGLAIRCLKN